MSSFFHNICLIFFFFPKPFFSLSKCNFRRRCGDLLANRWFRFGEKKNFCSSTKDEIGRCPGMKITSADSECWQNRLIFIIFTDNIVYVMRHEKRFVISRRTTDFFGRVSRLRTYPIRALIVSSIAGHTYYSFVKG